MVIEQFLKFEAEFKNKWRKVKLENIKGQLISKQNCRAINSPKKQTLDFYF